MSPSKKFLLVLTIAILPALPVMAQLLQPAQPQISTVPCDAFQHNPDGSWSPLHRVTITGPNGQVTMGPGVAFRPGVAFMGIDMATVLNRQCP